MYQKGMEFVRFVLTFRTFIIILKFLMIDLNY